jgi:hypothetical protein
MENMPCNERKESDENECIQPDSWHIAYTSSTLPLGIGQTTRGESRERNQKGRRGPVGPDKGKHCSQLSKFQIPVTTSENLTRPK